LVLATDIIAERQPHSALALYLSAWFVVDPAYQSPDCRVDTAARYCSRLMYDHRKRLMTVLLGCRIATRSLFEGLAATAHSLLIPETTEYDASAELSTTKAWRETLVVSEVDNNVFLQVVRISRFFPRFQINVKNPTRRIASIPQGPIKQYWQSS
jgi:hypothetical protein